MSSFSYQAKTVAGETQTGVREAKDERDLARALRQEGLLLLSAEGGEASAGETRTLEDFWRRLRPISSVEKMMFARHLAVMVKSGFSLPRALEVLEKQAESAKFSQVLEDLALRVRRGEAFAESLAAHPKVFSELFINMVRVGEAGGTLEEVLRVLANQMKKDYELRSKVRGALMYPAVILTALVGVGILMMVVVVPKLSEVFRDLGISLPATTRAIIAVSAFLARFWFLIPIGIVLLVFGIRGSLKFPQTKRSVDWLLLRFPILGRMVKKVEAARFARTFSSLIDSGTPIVNALEISSRTLGNAFFREALEVAAREVEHGTNLSKGLEPFGALYPPLVIQMIAVGEETGNLADILKNLAEFYEEEVSNDTKNLSSIIEPVLMIVIGVVVGVFAISMIQPMYSLVGGL
ncbi:type II secretion system F family protein [Candidatus Azambacteria bacterium]|nr:type II secretion system F family protein [Candidatus Azambacteria bacterium]